MSALSSTRRVNGVYFRNQILPWFRNMQIAEIMNQDATLAVSSWEPGSTFSAYSLGYLQHVQSSSR